MRNHLRALIHLNRNVRLLLLGWGTVLFAFFGLISVLQNLYLLRLGFGIEFIGLLVAISQFTWAACALPAGEFGRRFGTRTALLCGFSINAVAYTLFMAVEFLPRGWWETWLIGCWVLVWIGAAFNSVNVSPHWMVIASPEERHYAFAAQPAVSSAGAFLGSLSGGWLAAWLAGVLGPAEPIAPYRYGLFLAVLVNWLGLLPLLWTDPNQTARSERHAAAAGHVPWALFLLIGLATFLVSLGDGSVRAFFTVYLDQDFRIGVAQIGLALGLAQLLAFTLALGAPALTGRIGSSRSWAFGCLAVGGSLQLVAFAGQWQVAVAGYIGTFALSNLAGIGRTIYSQEVVHSDWRPTMSAVSMIGISLGLGYFGGGRRLSDRRGWLQRVLRDSGGGIPAGSAGHSESFGAARAAHRSGVHGGKVKLLENTSVRSPFASNSEV